VWAGLVAFDEATEVVFPLGSIRDEEKEGLLKKIKAIHLGTTTNIQVEKGSVGHRARGRWIGDKVWVGGGTTAGRTRCLLCPPPLSA
jgi:hypothetical protein